MATRPARNTSAVTDVKGKAAPIQNEMPAAWAAFSQEIETFAGHDLTEKKELVGIQFLITGVEIERNENRGYDVAYVYAMDARGNEFEFSDTSSTGVLSQLQALMMEKGMNPAPGAGFQKLAIACMKGLRVSEFEFIDQDPDSPKYGKARNVTTYYLGATGVSHTK